MSLSCNYVLTVTADSITLSMLKPNTRPKLEKFYHIGLTQKALGCK